MADIDGVPPCSLSLPHIRAFASAPGILYKAEKFPRSGLQCRLAGPTAVKDKKPNGEEEKNIQAESTSAEGLS